MRPIILLALLVTLLPALPAAAQGDSRCFPETGHCISGPIRAYWERNGGLPIFGYPISELKEESVFDRDSIASWRGPVQWFERDRLEDHSAEGLGVLAGRLGAEQLREFADGRLVPRPAPQAGAPAGCRYFPETRQSLCPPYRAYWEQNGGLERFGYPLSQPFPMTMGAWSGEVQYFERRRMEAHAELPGSPVLLGLLAREQRDQAPSAVCPTPLDPALAAPGSFYRFAMYLSGCPLPARRVGLAEQQFEGGVMIYAATGPSAGGDGQVFVVRTRQEYVNFSAFPNGWAEGQPESGGLTPPPGLLEPRRGFGKVWREQPGVREALGWAIAPERGDSGVYQPFTGGAAIVYFAGSRSFYLLGPNGLVWAF